MKSSLLDNLKNKLFEINRSTDLSLLLFLLLVMNVSLGVKLLAILFIYAVRRNFKFELSKGRLPWFYPLMMCLLVLQYFYNYNKGPNYLVLALLALSFWGASFLIIHQLKLAVEKNGIAKVEKTLGYFFVLNAIVTTIDILRIVFEIQNLNPYVFVGLNFKYFASTGDYLRGITLDLSTVNNIINSFGLFYFLYQRRYLLSALCYFVSVFTTSNVGNFILLFFFIYIIIFDRSKFHKSIVLCYISFLIIFVVKISPSNLNYLNNKAKNIFHLKNEVIERHWEDYSEKDKMISKYLNKNQTTAEPKYTEKRTIRTKIAEKEKEIEKKNHVQDSICIVEENKGRNRFVTFFNRYYGDTVTSLNQAYYDRYPGKVISFQETFKYVSEKPLNLIAGSGAGNFSSKLAFKASNLGISGKYVEKLSYIAPDFRDNHLKLTLRYYLKPISEHSVINFPNSVFNQLLGEYGIIGIVLFFVFYVWFFLKRIKILTYGRVLLPMFLMFLLMDYWFESLSIVIIFEIMMFLDIEKNNPKPLPDQE
jgi:hypothetical protein